MNRPWQTAFVLLGVVFLAHAEKWQPATFEVKVVGHGPPVIFIPGLGCSGEIWNSTVEHFRDRYECHVISIKGFGDTAAMTTRPKALLSSIRDEIINYIRIHDLVGPVIVGHSLGGTLTLDLAEIAPDIPRAVVIVDSAPFLAGIINPDVKLETVRSFAEGIREKVAKMTAEEFDAAQNLIVQTMVNSPENAKLLTQLIGKSDPGTVGEALAGLLLMDLRPGLAKIECPALIMVAGADRAAFLPAEEIEKNFRNQYSGLRGAKFLFFEKARHFLMDDEPEKFFAAMDAALVEQ